MYIIISPNEWVMYQSVSWNTKIPEFVRLISGLSTMVECFKDIQGLEISRFKLRNFPWNTQFFGYRYRYARKTNLGR